MNCCRRQKIDWADPAAEQGGSGPRISKFFLRLKEFRLGGKAAPPTDFFPRGPQAHAGYSPGGVLDTPVSLAHHRGRVDHATLPPLAPLGNNGNGREGPVCRLPYSPINIFERRECNERIKNFSWSIHQGERNHRPDGCTLVHGYRQCKRGQDGD